MENVNNLIDDYAKWFRSEITIANFGEYYELTTPFLDRFNDYLQIYIKQDSKGKILITDDGYIIVNLISSGVSFKTPKRKDMLDKILKNFSLRLEGNAITTIASPQDFAQKKHQMVQAMLHIDDMFLVSQNNVQNFFVEDIVTFFDANDIFYTPDFSLVGKTGSLYTYDFLFQRSSKKPERFCKAINKLDKAKRDLTIFNWIDTQERRNNSGELIVMLNDENTVNDRDINAFEQYDIKSVLFCERERYKELFTA